MWLRVFQHLLPHGRAWSITAEKTLRRFFNGLTGLGADVKEYVDGVWLDIFPTTTRELDGWEVQFGLPDTGLSEGQRRTRLAATWRALGGQSPRYIQDVLQGNGFDVYVHEWWVPGSEAAVGVHACATPRDPTALGAYPLVNRLSRIVPQMLVLCGEPAAQCGEEVALCGNFLNFVSEDEGYEWPTDPDKWAYILYIAGEDINDAAEVDAERREEFETLCLKIRPAQQWLGIIVTYV